VPATLQPTVPTDDAGGRRVHPQHASQQHEQRLQKHGAWWSSIETGMLEHEWRAHLVVTATPLGGWERLLEPVTRPRPAAARLRA
jgi:hypothetical protein